jgi:hypothetical protein
MGARRGHAVSVANTFLESRMTAKSGSVEAEIPLRRKTLFREVNEHIRGFLNSGDGLGEFLCECDGSLCGRVSDLTAEEWDAVCARPGRYVVATDHEDRSRGRIVERNERFTIVEDPRALDP